MGRLLELESKNDLVGKEHVENAVKEAVKLKHEDPNYHGGVAVKHKMSILPLARLTLK